MPVKKHLRTQFIILLLGLITFGAGHAPVIRALFVYGATAKFPESAPT